MSKDLDPPDWPAFRAQAHRMLDGMLDYLRDIRERPVWQPIPDAVRARFDSELFASPTDLALVHEEFMRYVLPFVAGNAHPGFLGWVQGGGTPVGMLAEMLAAGLNSNLGGRDHIPIEVERQIVRWMSRLFGFPESSTGLFVTGTSMANFIATIVARDTALGFKVRRDGVAASSQRLTAYASTAVHGSIARALDLAGIGSGALRLVPDLQLLEQTIEADRALGFKPFLVVGTVGTADTGAIDDLCGLADLSRRLGLWFHVDGAYGALAILAPELAPRLKGIERADSLAFDFHKWGQVPYDAGFLLVRDGVLHRNAFATAAAYLRREERGLAGGSPWPCDFGPDLSRGFRALKTWFTLKVYGTEVLGSVISKTCSLARQLADRIAETPELELMAPVELNIVCFRYRAAEADRVNARIAIDLQESGTVAPSTTTIGGRLAIRAAIVNHRTSSSEIEALVEQTLELGRALQSREPLVVENWQPRLARESALRDLDVVLKADPESVARRFERACLLAELGSIEQARDEYLALLARDPSHAGALNNLGTLLNGAGYRSAAGTAYRQAVAQHPDDPISLVNLANSLRQQGEVQSAQAHYERALQGDPDLREAHQGLAYVLAECGEESQAAWHREKAFRDRPVFHLPYRGERRPVRVLQLVSAKGGNIATRRLLDDRVFETFAVVGEFHDGKTRLPAHDLVFNAIGDADLASEALSSAEYLLALTTAPVINSPSVVGSTGRAANARRLSGIPGVTAPATVTLPRELLSDSGGATALARHGFEFPLLLRTPGFHTGRHFVKVDRPEGLSAAVEGLPGRELMAIQYLDSRGNDSKARKYRVMMIDGRFYPLHVAISTHWKIHYFTAEMADSAEHRAEDAAFLKDMPAILGSANMTALERIQTELGLDYGGIDFGLSATGELLLFEANAAMVVNPPETDERWAYRRQAVESIYAAVRKMLLGRAEAGAGRLT